MLLKSDLRTVPGRLAFQLLDFALSKTVYPNRLVLKSPHNREPDITLETWKDTRTNITQDEWDRVISELAERANVAYRPDWTPGEVVFSNRYLAEEGKLKEMMMETCRQFRNRMRMGDVVYAETFQFDQEHLDKKKENSRLSDMFDVVLLDFPNEPPQWESDDEEMARQRAKGPRHPLFIDIQNDRVTFTVGPEGVQRNVYAVALNILMCMFVEAHFENRLRRPFIRSIDGDLEEEDEPQQPPRSRQKRREDDDDKDVFSLSIVNAVMKLGLDGENQNNSV